MERWRARTGWELIPWCTLTDGFNADFGVAECHGTWSYLDITALGRQEEWEDSPAGYQQTPYEWWRRHDEYDEPAEAEAAASSASSG